MATSARAARSLQELPAKRRKESPAREEAEESEEGEADDKGDEDTQEDPGAPADEPEHASAGEEVEEGAAGAACAEREQSSHLTRTSRTEDEATPTVEPFQVYQRKFGIISRKLKRGPPVTASDYEALLKDQKHNKPTNCAKFGVLWAISVAGPDFPVLSKKEVVAQVLRAIIAGEGSTMATILHGSVQHQVLFNKMLVGPWQRAMQQAKADHRHRAQDVLTTIFSTVYVKDDEKRPGLASVLEFLQCKEGHTLLQDMKLPVRVQPFSSALFADKAALEDTLADEGEIVKALGNVDVMKQSSLNDAGVAMALLPVPQWPKDEKSPELHPFNPLFMYVFADIMGVNKEVHKSQPHSINLPKIVEGTTLDNAFEILLPRIPECPDLPGSMIPEQKLLAADVAAYVSYLIWMAPRKCNKYLDLDGASQALQHYEKRKLMYTKALQQKSTWLQTAMRAMKVVLGKADTPARGGGDAGTPDADGFEVPDSD